MPRRPDSAADNSACESNGSCRCSALTPASAGDRERTSAEVEETPLDASGWCRPCEGRRGRSTVAGPHLTC